MYPNLFKNSIDVVQYQKFFFFHVLENQKYPHFNYNLLDYLNVKCDLFFNKRKLCI